MQNLWEENVFQQHAETSHENPHRWKTAFLWEMWQNFQTCLLFRKAQCAERILDKIANPFNKTYAGWMSMIQGFQINFARNPQLKGIESSSKEVLLIWPGSDQIWQSRLCYLGDGFYALQYRVSCKIYLDSLGQALLPWGSCFERVYNFI